MNKENYLKDPSLWTLILGNFISIAMAVIQQWDMGQILWVYWAQSVIIGVINVYRIRSLKEFSTKNLKMNGKAVSETPKAKKQVANFFALHYGFFHLIYAGFMWAETPLFDIDNDDLLTLILLSFGFIGVHGFSYKYNINKDFKQQKPNIGTLMFYPYLRIIPMHLIIVLGMAIGSSFAIIIFMSLKTLADACTHMIEHHLFRREMN